MKEHVVKIFQAASLNVTGNLIKVGISFISLPIITRLLSPDLYGVFVLGTTVTYAANRIISLGIPGALSYFIPRYEAEQSPEKVRAIIRYALLVHLALSLVALGTLFLMAEPLATVFGKPELAPVLRIISACVPCLILIDNAANIFAGVKEARTPIILNSFLQPILRITLIAAFLLLGYALLGITIAHTVSLLITAAIFLFLVFHKLYRRFPKSTTFTDSKRFWSYALPLAGTEIVFLVFGYTDILTIGKYLEADQAAIYNVSFNLGKLLNLLPVAVLILYKPITSQLFALGKTKEIQEILRLVGKWIAIVNTPLLAACIVLPDVILRNVFPPEYVVGALSLQLLAIGFFVATMLGPVNQLFEAAGKTRISLLNAVASTAVNVGLNLLLVPNYGITGAAVATGASMICMATVATFQLWWVLRINAFSRELTFVILTGGASIVVFLIVKQFFHIETFLLALVSGIVFTLGYVVTLVTLGIISPHDRALLTAITRRRT